MAIYNQFQLILNKVQDFDRDQFFYGQFSPKESSKKNQNNRYQQENVKSRRNSPFNKLNKVQTICFRPEQFDSYSKSPDGLSQLN